MKSTPEPTLSLTIISVELKNNSTQLILEYDFSAKIDFLIAVSNI